MRLYSGSANITSVRAWYELTPPKGGEAHWTDGRSALELAKAWCGDAGPRVPDEVAALLTSHPHLARLHLMEMSPEARVTFDRRRGEPRNADLAGIATDASGVAVVHVEGKADEPFGARIGEELDAAERRRREGITTNAPERIHDLVTSLLPGADIDDPAIRALRYQLFTATAAALADAERRAANRAVLLVHEFVTARTDPARQAENARDLDAFVRAVSAGAVAGVNAGSVVGPLRVPGAPLVAQVSPLYVGKAVRVVATTAT